MKKRVKNGSAPRYPQSDRLTVVAWTFTRTSPSFGAGPLDLLDAQDLGRPVAIEHNCSHVVPFRFLRLLRVPDRPALLPHAAGPVELGRLAAGRAGPGPAPGRDHPAVLREEAPPEVGAVEMHAPDGLVHRSELGERERRSEECRRDPSQLEVDADAVGRVADDPRVIESQLERAVQRRP